MSHSAVFTSSVTLTINGRRQVIDASPFATLADGLRDALKLTGTKIGCEAGDCGACTVLMDGRQVCSCLVPLGQCEGAEITTVEGADDEPLLTALQQAFLDHGAAQCGICTPGMLLSSLELLKNNASPTRAEAEFAIAGTLCRCTGYLKIIDAVLQVAGQPMLAAEDKLSPKISSSDSSTCAVGESIIRVDGREKTNGTELYGADFSPEGCLWMRVIRSPYAHARFTLGDTASLCQQYDGLTAVLTARDVPGHNGFGIYPTIKDQPVFADGRVLYRGEAVAALVGDRDCVESIAVEELAIEWIELPALMTNAEALAEGAPLLHAERAGNVLIKGRVRKGSDACFTGNGCSGSQDLVKAQGSWESSFVEHAYIEPEAGFARRVGDRIEVHASTQAPQMDLEEVANVLGLATTDVRIIPTACGGGFGGKLDVSVQPLLAVAAWVLRQPVATVFSRIESMASSTKRHPSQLTAEAVATSAGKLVGYRLQGDFNTGAYASWGPTVAGRVPAHCCGPYDVPNVYCDTRAVHTHAPPSGAFRGFGTPQAAIPRELLYDELADACDIDRLEFRRINAFRRGHVTPTGQTLEASCGLSECLDALLGDWQQLCDDRNHFNQPGNPDNKNGQLRRGVGVACMWYGCGNTALSNPSAMRVELTRDGRFVFYNGAVDIGQGSSTVLSQICADALGVAVDQLDMINGDTDLTEDAGKTSASRQTFVSGKAAQLAGENLRQHLLQLMGINQTEHSRVTLSVDQGTDELLVRFSASQSSSPHGEQDDETTLSNHSVNEDSLEGEIRRPLDALPVITNALGIDVIAEGFGEFDPPITTLDENGQGSAYATYAFAAQICSVDIDLRFGLVKPRQFVAAHDVGRAINPQLIEGQVHGGIMQGLGMALMEEYLPGRTENLHDYLIPTAGDVPQIDVKIIESPEPLGPYGAKGVGEPALVPTPAAILCAIRDATGIVIRKVPVLPHRMFKELQKAGL